MSISSAVRLWMPSAMIMHDAIIAHDHGDTLDDYTLDDYTVLCQERSSRSKLPGNGRCNRGHARNTRRVFTHHDHDHDHDHAHRPHVVHNVHDYILYTTILYTIILYTSNTAMLGTLVRPTFYTPRPRSCSQTDAHYTTTRRAHCTRPHTAHDHIVHKQHD